ncbi:actin-associated protein FAM107A [Polymixia lowei]
MQQELLLRAKSQVLSSIKPVCALRATSAATSYNGDPAEFKRSSSVEGQTNPFKASRTHQELHKELLLAHKKGLALSSKPELQQVLERRKREQTDREEEEQTRTPLEEVLLKRQQTQLEKEKQEEEKVREENQLFEFVRVRQNLRKIHTAIQNKASNSQDSTEE